jgi:hypothetical protein
LPSRVTVGSTVLREVTKNPTPPYDLLLPSNKQRNVCCSWHSSTATLKNADSATSNAT